MYFVSLFLIKTCVSNTCSLATVTELRFKSSRVKTIKIILSWKSLFPGSLAVSTKRIKNLSYSNLRKNILTVLSGKAPVCSQRLSICMGKPVATISNKNFHHLWACDHLSYSHITGTQRFKCHCLRKQSLSTDALLEQNTNWSHSDQVSSKRLRSTEQNFRTMFKRSASFSKTIRSFWKRKSKLIESFNQLLRLFFFFFHFSN